MYRNHALAQIAAGRAGTLRLAPRTIWLKISDNCNLRCVGCYSVGKFRKRYAPLDEVRQALEFEGDIAEINFTTNEALLHPQFCDIIDLCRARHPNAALWVISNGTIPIRGRYAEAISKLDKVSLSIDGATSQTYEGIRVGARFDDFLANVQQVVAIRKDTGRPKSITFAFTATRTNLHELIDVVRIAHVLGISDIWAQAMEAKDEIVKARVSDILLDTMDPALRRQLIDAARTEAIRLNMPFYFSSGIYPGDLPHTRGRADEEARALDIRMCQYPWEQPVQVSHEDDGYVVRPCCYISTTKTNLLAERYGLRFDGPLTGDDIYNSPQMWAFREAMVHGRTGDVCGGCEAARGYSWKTDALDKPDGR